MQNSFKDFKAINLGIFLWITLRFFSRNCIFKKNIRKFLYGLFREFLLELLQKSFKDFLRNLLKEFSRTFYKVHSKNFQNDSYRIHRRFVSGIFCGFPTGITSRIHQGISLIISSRFSRRFPPWSFQKINYMNSVKIFFISSSRDQCKSSNMDFI